MLEQSCVLVSQPLVSRFDLLLLFFQDFRKSFVAFCIEELGQKLLFVSRARGQKLTEAPLGQHDHLTKLRHIKTQKLLDSFRHPRRLRLHHLPVLIIPAPIQAGLVRLLGRALTAFFGPFMPRDALKLVAHLAKLELKNHLGDFRGLGVLTAQVFCLPLPARAVAVQRKAHCIQDGGLARAGWAVDQKEIHAAKLVKVNNLFVGVGPKCAEGELSRAHEFSPPAHDGACLPRPRRPGRFAPHPSRAHDAA